MPLVLALVVAAAVFGSACSGSDDNGANDSSAEDSGAGSTDDASAICAEGATDCDDTPDTGGAGDNPDEPVSNDVDTSPAAAPCSDDADCEARSRDIAVRDLSAQLGVEAVAISVVSTEAVQWPDACLGAAGPGTACAEVITPGFKVLLEHNGTTYEYHTDRGTRAVLLVQ